MTRMIRLAHVVTHPIQYFAPLYRQIHSDGELDLTVLFGSHFGVGASFDAGFQRKIQFDVPLTNGYNSKLLENRGEGMPNGRASSFSCPTIERDLREGQFDAVWIHGWGYRLQWQAIRAARRLGLPYFIRAETHWGSRPANFWRSMGRRFVLGRMLRKAEACLYVGKRSREFYLRMGVDPARLLPAHYSVDAQRFADLSQAAGSNPSGVLPRGNEDEFAIVTVGKAIECKRLDTVIEAVARCPSHIHLRIIGDGPLRKELEDLGRRLAPDRIHWLGFVNQSQLPAVLAKCDALVLASERETWGLVVNEAMACGLPAIVSRETGVAWDLVDGRDTGFMFSAGDVEALSSCMTRMAEDREAARRMGARGKELVIQEYDVKVTARQIADAVQRAFAIK